MRFTTTLVTVGLSLGVSGCAMFSGASVAPTVCAEQRSGSERWTAADLVQQGNQYLREAVEKTSVSVDRALACFRHGL